MPLLSKLVGFCLSPGKREAPARHTRRGFFGLKIFRFWRFTRGPVPSACRSCPPQDVVAVIDCRFRGPEMAWPAVRASRKLPYRVLLPVPENKESPRKCGKTGTNQNRVESFIEERTKCAHGDWL